MRTLGMLKRSIATAPEKVKCLAYKTLCLPKLEYAVEVWGPFLVKHVNALEAIQSKAVRFIANIRGTCGVTERRKALGMELLTDRRREKRISTFHKILSQSDNPSFRELNEFIDRYFSTDRQCTRSQAQGLLVAVSAGSRASFNGFVIRTARDLRLGPN